MKLGVMLANLGPSQLSYNLVRRANALVSRDATMDVTAFIESQSSNPLPAAFAQMPIYEAWGYTGTLVATSVSTAGKLLKCMRPAASFFYVWDLEWVRPFHGRTYRELAEIYRNPRLTLLARSASHQRIISEAWNRPVAGVVEDLNLEVLFEHIKRSKYVIGVDRANGADR